MNIVYKFLCEQMFPILLDICLEGELLLAHVMAQCLTF